MIEIEGEDRGDVKLYALSTCVWCKRTRQFLERMGVRYRYIYVDLLEGEERERAIGLLEKYNPSLSFPTIVIDEKKVIIGFEEDLISDYLGGKKNAGQRK